MRTSFSGLDIAYRALQAQQQAIDVTNHNIANVNTPGFSRQAVRFVATSPLGGNVFNAEGRLSQMGTGAEVADIRRMRNTFYDYQIRTQDQTLARWEGSRDALKQVELVFNEPSDVGVGSFLSKFWQSWQDVTNSPQDIGVRGAMVEQADSLAVCLNRTDAQLDSIRSDLDSQIRLRVDSINSLAQQIADLNVRIVAVEVSGQPANDMRDKRDYLLDELSRLARVTYTENADGALTVFMGSRTLVTIGNVQGVSYTVDTNGLATLTWQNDGSPVVITDGELYGLLQARDVQIPKYIADLDALAAEIIDQVNTLHTAGFGLDNSTGMDFFQGTGAGDIAVNPALKARPDQVAAAGAADSPGDNSNARAIAALQRALTMDSGTADFGRFYAGMMARLGVDSQRAETVASNQGLLVDHLKREKEAVSGVSLDEETTHLIEYQRAYEAAARVITVVDEMLDKIINGMGLVGR